MNTFNRRDFMKTVAAGSAALAFLNHFSHEVMAAPAESDSKFMGGLTAISVLNDIALLAMAGKQVSLNNVARIESNINYPLSANLSRVGMIMPAEKSAVETQLRKLSKEVMSLEKDIKSASRYQKYPG